MMFGCVCRRDIGSEVPGAKHIRAARGRKRLDTEDFGVMAQDMCVIVNPTAGRGRARRWLEELQQAPGAGVELRHTTAPGHGEELAFEAVRAGFPVVAAAGGDGTVHEVANGILRAGRPDVVFHVLPVGSANDYVHSLERETEGSDTPRVRSVDVGLARRPDGRQRYFVNGLGLGFNGAVTQQARRIRWLRGVPLYALALWLALWRDYDCPEMTITLDEQQRQAPTVALSVALGRREGGFVLCPQARLADGAFDYLHVGPLGRWQVLAYLPRMVLGRIPSNDPKVSTGRCKHVIVQSEKPLSVHLDGEFFCLPKDAMRGIEIEIQPAALQVSWGWDLPLAAKPPASQNSSGSGQAIST
jgi:diacylglycerol kinase family enzyme